MENDTISFTISNSTNGVVPVSILGNPANQMDNANATTRYAWDVTSLTFTNLNTIIIEYKSIFQPSFSLAELSFSLQTYQGVCDALNTLNLGVFFETTSGGSTFINNYNENFVFGQLNIYNNLLSTATFNNFTTFNPSFSTLAWVVYIQGALPAVQIVSSGDGYTETINYDGISFPSFGFDISSSATGTVSSYLEIVLNGTIVYSNFGTFFPLFSVNPLMPPNQYEINWYDNIP